MERPRKKTDEHLERTASTENRVKKRKRERSSSSLHSSSSREKKMKKRKNKHSRSSSDSSLSASSSSSSPSRGRKKTKKRKHKHSRSSSSFSNSSSSSRERKKRKKKKKHKHKNKRKEKEQKKLMSDTAISSNIGQPQNSEVIGPQVSLATIAAKGEKKSKSKAMRPMTKEEWEKQQSVVRKVYDPESGRTRLVKGDGEILEEIVNKEQHREINKQATRGDGLYFQTQMGIRDK